MKKIMMLALAFILSLGFANAQNGLEDVVVEVFYVADANDAAFEETEVAVEEGSVTYRVYVDMAPGWEFQALYAESNTADNKLDTLRIESTMPFFNNSDRGETFGYNIGTNRLDDNTVMLDSYLSTGRTSEDTEGVLKSEDTDGAIENGDGILQNDDPLAGIPISVADGNIASTSTISFTPTPGFENVLSEIFGEDNLVGNSLVTGGAALGLTESLTGPTADNRVLIGQFTTLGDFSFELNVQLRNIETGEVQQWVARTPQADQFSIPALIYPLAENMAPTASFVANPTTGTTPLDVAVNGTASSDSDGEIVSYDWDFGNGMTASAAMANTTYTMPGTYTITLTVTDNDGATATTTETIVVTEPANVEPMAAFTATPTSGDAPLIVAVDAANSSDSDGEVVSYMWDFGNGTTGSGVTANATYTMAGSYTITLTVADDDGATNTTTQSITVSMAPPVNMAPAAAFVAIPETGEAPLDVAVDASASSDSDGTITDYSWDFGNGTMGTGVNANTTYTDPGTYVITLTVTDDDGATATAEQTITVIQPIPNVAPTAAFNAAPLSGVPPLVVNFDASGSSDSDGTIASYAWDYGDGNSGTGVMPTHTFNEAGSYTVTLTVTDDDGATATATETVNLASANQEALDGIIVETYYVADANDAASPQGVVEGAVTYRVYVDMAAGWEFQALYGENFPAQNKLDTLKIYSTEPFFNNEDRGATFGYDINTDRLEEGTVLLDSYLTTGRSSEGTAGVLKSEDADGAVANADGLLQNDDPLAGIPISQQDGNIPTNADITFNATPGFGNILSAIFGEDDQVGNSLITNNAALGLTETLTGPTEDNKLLIGQFTTHGQFCFELNVQLRNIISGEVQQWVAQTPQGDQYSMPSLIFCSEAPNVEPVADFTATPESGFAPLTVAVDGSASFDEDGEIVNYAWDFGNGTLGSGITAETIYETPGTYTITLTVTDNDGATSTATTTITVEEEEPETYTLQILHASDLEGGVEAIPNAPNFAAIVDALEDEIDNSITLSAGDNYIPGPFFNAAGNNAFRSVLQDVYQDFFNEPGLTNLREAPGRVDITIMNIVGFDASAVGNHEFDAGPNAYSDIIGTDIRGETLGDVRWLGSQFPYLSSNLDFTTEGDLAGLATTDILPNTAFQSLPSDLTAAGEAPKLAPATIITRGGETIGVIGATTQILKSISSPGGVGVVGPEMNDMPALAGIIQPIIDQMTADGIDKIIVVSHLQQVVLELELATLLDGVDVIIAGGSDALIAQPDDALQPGDVATGIYPITATNAGGQPVAILSTPGEYTYVGRLVVEFDENGVVIPESLDNTINGVYATTADVVDDVAGPGAFDENTKGELVRRLTTTIQDLVTEQDGNIIGRTSVFIEGRREAVRTQQTNMGDLTADANLNLAQSFDATVEVSIKNGGGIRAAIGQIIDNGDGTSTLAPPQANPEAGKEEGDISQLDAQNTLRFNNGLTLLTLTVPQLLEVLEHALAETELGSTPGRFPQVGGIRFYVDLDQPAESRVTDVFIIDEAGENTEQLVANSEIIADENRTIRLVTLDFIAGGGDGYPFPSDAAANRVDLEDVLTNPGMSTFADPGSEQDAFAEFLMANYLETPYGIADTPIDEDDRIIFGAPPVSGGTARVQFIHAAPFETVRMEIDGVDYGEIYYRTASPYLDVPAGVPVNIELIPTNFWTTVSAQTVTMTFTPDETHVLTFYGTFDDTDDIPFEATKYTGSRETVNDDEIGMLLVHASPDQQEVDVVVNGTVLFDDVEYGTYNDNYVVVPEGNYIGDLTAADDNSNIFYRYDVNIEWWKGNTMVLFAIGTEANDNFETWVALSNGGTFPLSELPFSMSASGITENFATESMIDRSNRTLHLFPNPVIDVLVTSMFVSEENNVSIEIFDVRGHKLLSVFEGAQDPGMYRYETDLSQFAAGMYYVKMTSDIGSTVKPIVVVK